MLAIFLTVLLTGFYEVSPEFTTSTTENPIVEDVRISTFLDDNDYIRLNISWGKKLCDVDNVSVYFTTTEDCDLMTDVEDYALDNYFLIRPSMELEHPADRLIHGCVYDVTLEDKSNFCGSQSLSYEIPECVENRCQCRDVFDSPNKLTRITPISGINFLLEWNTTTEENITIHELSYKRKGINNSIETHIPVKSLMYKNNSVELPLHDVKESVDYTMHVIFIDEFNECLYSSSLDFKKPSKSHVLPIAVSVVVIVTLLLVIYRVTLLSPKVRNKLEKYVFLSKSYRSHDNEDMVIPLAQSKLREEINAQYTPLEFVLKAHKYDKYEFPRNKIIFGKTLGEGAFGKVLYGKAFEIGANPGFTEVAVKQLKDQASAEEIIDFQAEIDMLKRIRKHQNIVELLGCVTMDQPYLMIMELVSRGNLKNYLLNLRKKWSERKSPRIFFPDDMDEDWFKTSDRKLQNGKVNYTSCVFDTSEGSYLVPTTPQTGDSTVFLKPGQQNNDLEAGRIRTPTSMNSSRLPSSTGTEFTNVDLETPTPLTAEMNRLPEPVLDHTELQQFAFQIASGMLCLEKLSITHRDLAARNILVTSNRVLKIADFGMSRNGLYVHHKSKKVPLRWMAIESIESLKWDNKSDVWAFGVVLWEIGTLGAFPYENIHNDILLSELKKGKRLERPEICTDELYKLMARCWSEKPEERPTFNELTEVLDVSKRKVYVDFDQISPKYVFPPSKSVDEDVELKSDKT